MATTSRRFVEGDAGGSDMKASLWGDLQSFINLSMIYAKLPVGPFFRLRLVCKEWNRLASDRQFLEQNFKPPFSSKPYFVITRPTEGEVFWWSEDQSWSSTLLASEGSSWSLTPLPLARCEVSGLLFEDSHRNRVFDLHTRVFHTLPPLPPVPQELVLRMEEDDDYEDHVLLMTVDTTRSPYAFRVILAHEIIGVRICNSNSGAWTHKLSPTYEYYGPEYGTPCLQYNKFLHMRVGKYCDGWFFVISYDLEKNEWDCEELGTLQDVWRYTDIGIWQDRCFVFAVNNYESQLNVWESSPNFGKPWVEFDNMPKDLREWMCSGDDLYTINKFHGEYVLLFNRVEDEERAVLYNLDKKTWDRIEFPTQPILSKGMHSSKEL